MKHPGLRAELLALEADDESTRERLAATGDLFLGYHPDMEAVHRKNALRLREITEDHGWPGHSLVGKDGATAAWRIVQHAIGEPALVRWFFPLLEDAVRNGAAEATQLAMLVDRIRVNEGRPQLYGTQYDWSTDGHWMAPIGDIEDVEHLETRRRAVGLGPMQWRREPATGESPPSDLDARRREIDAWARRVGWRA